MNSGKRAYFLLFIFFSIGMLSNLALAQISTPSAYQDRLEKVYNQLPEAFQNHVKLFSERKFRFKFQQSDLEIEDLQTLRAAFLRLPPASQLNIIHFAERKFRIYTMNNNGKEVFESLEESKPSSSSP